MRYKSSKPIILAFTLSDKILFYVTSGSSYAFPFVD